MNKQLNNSQGFWKRRSSKILLRHPRMLVIEDQVQLPEGSVVPYLRYETGGDGVTVICVEGDRVLVQKEYSYPVDEFLLQLPGGKMYKNETPAQAAKRELIEESGIEIKEEKTLGWYYPNNRRTDAKMYVLFTDNFQEVKKEGGDQEEHITSSWIKITDLKQMIRNNEITNYSILTAWTLYEQN